MDISLKSICHFGNRRWECPACPANALGCGTLTEALIADGGLGIYGRSGRFFGKKEDCRCKHDDVKVLEWVNSPHSATGGVQAYRPERPLKNAAERNLDYAALKVAPTNKRR